MKVKTTKRRAGGILPLTGSTVKRTTRRIITRGATKRVMMKRRCC
jgi:hypothetical protein